MQTGQEYYSDPNNYGSYQFFPLTEVLDSLVLESQADTDSYLKNVDRFLLKKYAVAGLRDMAFSGQGDVIELEINIGDDLQFILPQDYVDYLKVSVISEDFHLETLDYNPSIHMGKAYLQDHEYDIIFDSEGAPINVDGNNTFRRGHKIYEFGNRYAEYLRHDHYAHDYNINADTSKFTRHGEFDIDQRRGVISFSSNLAGRDIVLQYLSDGLNEKAVKNQPITIHKYYKEPLENYIYYAAIRRKRNVPYNEKERAKREYKTNKHIAKVLMLNLDPQRIMRVMRSAFKPVKT
ncbi:hypothetical protein [Aquimarina algiphila]|uniref:Uncharacterized protein n=1 Tax=Aquimarina algiphila TaxID=2047982 RepID=A0A554VRI6_9FLAO|nr:hypothetical protein [Aquimarina algiphila]TSE11274.1 hypothetical protein FOF46_01200 [Aquimarina algiphila]